MIVFYWNAEGTGTPVAIYIQLKFDLAKNIKILIACNVK